MRLVDEFIDFKRAGDESLSGAEAVRRRYLEDWEDHAQVVVTVNRIFGSASSAAIEIHVESCPPSNVWCDAVVVHDWSSKGRLSKYRLYVDEVLLSLDPSNARKPAGKPARSNRPQRAPTTATDQPPTPDRRVGVTTEHPPLGRASGERPRRFRRSGMLPATSLRRRPTVTARSGRRAASPPALAAPRPLRPVGPEPIRNASRWPPPRSAMTSKP